MVSSRGAGETEDLGEALRFDEFLCSVVESHSCKARGRGMGR